MTGLARFVDRGDRDAPLQRFLAGRGDRRTEEACEMCAARIGERHRHIVDLERQGLLCACRPCGLLFTGDGAARWRYRVVPEPTLRIEPFLVTAEQWSALQVPVGIAFFLRRSQPEATVAFYPSPAGATESELPLDAWEDIVAANPALGVVETDTEAALVRATGREAQCFIVPVDRCYQLVGELRMTWSGFDGGQEARARIAAFFEDLHAHSRLAEPGP